MKRWFGLLIVLFSFLIKGHAAITDRDVLQEKTVKVHFSTAIPASANPSSFILISLSTPTGFPHLERGELDISHIEIDMDKLAASTASVRIGVVTFVNTSTGSVSFFCTKNWIRNLSNTEPKTLFNYSPAFVRAKVAPGSPAEPFTDGATPFILTNETRSGSTIYRSTTSVITQLNGSLGRPMAPGVGDIVMEVVNGDTGNTLNLVVDLSYHSEK